MANDEDVERLKTWWKENGRTVIGGVVFGLGSIIGWNAWLDYKERRAEQASQLYAGVVEAAVPGEHAAAHERTALLLSEFPRSGYATLGAFVAAGSAAAHDRSGAKYHLEWITENAPRDEYRDLARIRLARILLDEEDPEAALALLDAVSPHGFGAVTGELRGDIHLARGAPDEARAAWQEVLADEGLLPSSRVRVRMKLDDLGHLHVP